MKMVPKKGWQGHLKDIPRVYNQFRLFYAIYATMASYFFGTTFILFIMFYFFYIILYLIFNHEFVC